MNIDELQLKIYELIRTAKHTQQAEQFNNMIENISHLLILMRNNHVNELNAPIMIPINALLKKFWSWAATHIPREQWHCNEEISLYLSLHEMLVKHKLLEDTFQLKLFAELKSQYEKVPSRLPLAPLMELIIKTARMIGYVSNDKSDINKYPAAPLEKKIKSHLSQEAEKIKNSLFLLRAIYYLLYNECSAEQLSLIPTLLLFRSLTTDEERRSELAIVNWIIHHGKECGQFFAGYKDYIDMNPLLWINEQVAQLLPTCKKKFIQISDEKRWIFAFRNQLGISDKARVKDALSLIKEDFASQSDRSLKNALEFTKHIQTKLPLLTQAECTWINEACRQFCLEKSDLRFSFFSKENPCMNSLKKGLGFFELRDLSQSSLTQIANFCDYKTQIP